MRLTQKLRNTATHYRNLHARKTHPAGRFDHAGRWFPDHEHACCHHLRAPSRQWPYSLLTHARTLAHVARDAGYEIATLRAAVRRVEREEMG